MARAKEALRRALPPRAYRAVADGVHRTERLAVAVAALGWRYQCPFCGWRFRRLGARGVASPAFTERRVIGGGRREGAECPRCLSFDRERLLLLYLRAHTDVLSRPQRLLHVAPEPRLGELLRAQPHLDYLSADLSSPRAMVRMDITRIDRPDAAFDAILCNHVLEHIPDDGRAMRELLRVLAPGGWAILQVPIAPDAPTYEDPAITAPDARARAFGQQDHVRIYGADYRARLAAAGFAVEVCDFAAELGAAAVARHALLPDEKIYVCRRAGAD